METDACFQARLSTGAESSSPAIVPLPSLTCATSSLQPQLFYCLVLVLLCLVFWLQGYQQQPRIRRKLLCFTFVFPGGCPGSLSQQGPVRRRAAEGETQPQRATHLILASLLQAQEKWRDKSYSSGAASWQEPCGGAFAEPVSPVTPRTRAVEHCSISVIKSRSTETHFFPSPYI